MSKDKPDREGRRPAAVFLVVDDIPEARRAWCRALRAQGYVAHGASGWIEARRLMDELDTIDAALVDMVLEDGPGSLLPDLLADKHPEARAVIISAHFDEEIERLLEGRNVRAESKAAAARRLSDLARELTEPSDRLWLALRRLAARFGLSRRELMVVHRMARGVAPDEIPASLDRKPGTVKTQWESIRGKLDVGSMELVAAALLAELCEGPGGLQEVVACLAAAAGLSPRETEVLGCLAGGVDPRDIPGRLGIRPGTVKNHFGGIYRKTKPSDRLAPRPSDRLAVMVDLIRLAAGI